MQPKLNNSAEALILDLKRTIDNIHEKYGDDAVLDSLVYADKEYSLMQRGELKEIISRLAALKEQVDRLSEDCREIPVKNSNSAEETQQKISPSELRREALVRRKAL